jgi:hypothetical protein
MYGVKAITLSQEIGLNPRRLTWLWVAEGSWRRSGIQCFHATMASNKKDPDSRSWKRRGMKCVIKWHSFFNIILFQLSWNSNTCAVLSIGLPLTFEHVTRLTSASTTSYERQALEKRPYLWEVLSIPVPQAQPPLQKHPSLRSRVNVLRTGTGNHIHGLVIYALYPDATLDSWVMIARDIRAGASFILEFIFLGDRAFRISISSVVGILIRHTDVFVIPAVRDSNSGMTGRVQHRPRSWWVRVPISIPGSTTSTW